MNWISMSTVAENAPAEVPVLNVISMVDPIGWMAAAKLVRMSLVRVTVVIVRARKPLFAGAAAGAGYRLPA